MAENRKYCTEEFELANVMLQPFYVVYVILFVVAPVPILIFTEVIQKLFWHGGLPLTIVLWVLFTMLFLKIAAEKVVIYFDQKSMFIGDDKGNFKRYLRKDIAGIYSYNYDERERSLISITVVLTSGKKIYFTDTQLFDRRDNEKAQMLKRFLNAAKKRLEVNCVKKDKWRSIQGIGAHWYAGFTPLNDLLLVR